MASNLSKTYRLGKTAVVALDRVQFTVSPGDRFAIVGTSGSGKTTLLNCLGGLERPDGGTLHVGGQNLLALSDAQLSLWRREKVGFVFQNFNLLPTLSAMENVEYPLTLLGWKGAARKKAAQEALAQVGLEEFGCHRPADLSGGQRQRVALARALVKQPALVLADEPSANLDEPNTRQILELMEALGQRTGVTFVIASHDPVIVGACPSQLRLTHGVVDRAAERGLKCA